MLSMVESFIKLLKKFPFILIMKLKSTVIYTSRGLRVAQLTTPWTAGLSLLVFI
jgi:hypothetical protein